MITLTDAEQLIVQLERKAGSHIHIVGKTIFYLRQIADNSNARFSNCTADDFVKHVKTAVYYNNWEPLGTVMARWW